MHKYLKLALWGLGGLAFVLVLVAFVVATRFHPNDYKPEIERLAKEHTGRTLKLGGDLQLAFFPSIGVKIAGVRLSERNAEEDFVTLDSAHVSVKVLPLLAGSVVVDTIRVSGLQANVTKGKDGKFNFDDLLGGGKKNAAAAPAGGEGGAPLALEVSGVKIDRSSVTYRDLAAGSELVLADFRLSTGRVAPRTAGSLELAAALKGSKPQVDARLELDAQYSVDLPQRNVALPKLSAELVVAAPELPAKTLKITTSGNLQADLEKQLVNADLLTRFDETIVHTKLGLANFATPSYRFDINVDRFNADRYVKKEKAAKPAAKAAAPAAETDTPVDLSFLKGLNANGRLQAGALQVGGIKLAKVHAEVKAANGRMDVAPHSANLYEGSVSGALTLHADNRVALKETLAGVAIGPLLRDAAEMDRLEGRGNVAFDVAAAGRTVGAMKKALSGSAQLNLKDGTLKGIDLLGALRKASSPLGRRSAAEEKTEFAGLFASFRIKDGVARNDDLAMHATLFRVAGKGDVDIGASKLDYQIKASLVDPGKERAGMTVPVRFSGPFAGPAYDVDYGAVAKDVARTKVGDRIKDLLKR